MQRQQAKAVARQLGEWKQEVQIPSGTAELSGEIIVPPAAQGIVLFAHGSGSSRHSSRNQQVAQHIRTAGIATLLFDLLITEDEEALQQLRCTKAIQIIPGATHLFEEPGALAQVAQLATAWFQEYLQIQTHTNMTSRDSSP